MRLLYPRPCWTLKRIGDPRRCISHVRPFAVDDLVILRNAQNREAPPILTRPLKHGKIIDTHKGNIHHDDIIGKRVRDTVETTFSKSSRAPTKFFLQHVSLDEYCCLTRRLVTPIYPADANLIVSLLDLHPDASVESDGEESKLEVLEAGTGHGALTLHLSRAIHAANVPRESHDETAPDQDSRRAVIHSVEVSPRFSEHAQQVVKGFRHGLYAKNVDFHVGNVSDWVKEAFKSRGSSPFLSHAFLDLPSADVHMANVAEALRVDGTLVVFNPSITQITECAKHVKEERIPLDLAKVVELGVNGGSGGREWDVRFVRPRSLGKLQAEAPGLPSDTRSSLDSEDEVAASESEERTPTVPTEQRGWSFVCRPKVGERIIGGGFLGVWKKTSHSTVAPVDA